MLGPASCTFWTKSRNDLRSVSPSRSRAPDHIEAGRLQGLRDQPGIVGSGLQRTRSR